MSGCSSGCLAADHVDGEKKGQVSDKVDVKCLIVDDDDG